MNDATMLALCFCATDARAKNRTVCLKDQQGRRIEITTLKIEPAGGYRVEMAGAVFADHFPLMRPLKCLERSAENWCAVPPRHEIKCDVSETLTDLEYDFLSVCPERGAGSTCGTAFAIRSKL